MLKGEGLLSHKSDGRFSTARWRAGVKGAFRDRTSWYDGYLFEKIMGKRSRSMFVEPICSMIESGSSVIDIGCGTGSLVLALSHRCTKVVGIDSSSRMFRYALTRLSKTPSPGVTFYHLPASLLSATFAERFDYSILSQVLHETPARERRAMMEEAQKISGRSIIADYTAPLPRNTYGLIIKCVESFAGSEHNLNFKSWQLSGGIDRFIADQGLVAEESQPYRLAGREIGVGKIVKVVYTTS
jgi:ubiquinone/menaquinone biosynthesis C-methylase UbiE